METSDYRYLVKGWDETSKVKLKGEPKQIWEKIYIEYCDLTEDNRALLYYKLLHRIHYLEARKFIANNILLSLMSRDIEQEVLESYAKELAAWGFVYDLKKEKHEALENLGRQIKFADNEIELKRFELENLESNKKAAPLTKQVVWAEQALGKNVIDPKTTSVEKWVFYMELVKEINKEKSKYALSK